MKLFFVLAALLAVQSLFSLYGGYRFLQFVRKSFRQPLRDFTPPAAVIVPCKGIDAGFDENVSMLLAQDYPRYQVVFVVASEKDPASARLSAQLQANLAPGKFPGVQTALVVAGTSDVRGEKVNNLIRGVAAVPGGTEVLAFADIDARRRRDWLRALVAPLADPQATVSTGFRWYLPGPGFASQLRAAWDTSLATLLGDHNHNFAWGGSMAIRAQDFNRLQVLERYWQRTVSDDYGVSRAVWDARGHIRFEPRCLLASREESSLPAQAGLKEFWSWANRQIIITRVYARRLWLLGLLANLFHCGTFALGVIVLMLPGTPAPARLEVIAVMAFLLLPGIAKGRLKTIVARELFPEEMKELERFGGRYWQLAPLVPWVMLLNFVVAGFVSRIEWRGTVYELRSASEVRVLRRRE